MNAIKGVYLNHYENWKFRHLKELLMYETNRVIGTSLYIVMMFLEKMLYKYSFRSIVWRHEKRTAEPTLFWNTPERTQLNSLEV